MITGRNTFKSFVFLISLIGALFFWRGAAPKPRYELVISRAKLPAFLLLYVAEQLKFFEAEKLRVTFREFPLGKDALADVLAGHADLATVFETPVVISTYQGEKISILTTLHTATQGTAFLVRRNISTARDLGGKRIGVPLNTSMEFFLYMYLKSYGIPRKTVRIIDLHPTEMERALREGHVDVVAVYEPWLHKLSTALPNLKLKTFYSDVYTEISLLVGRNEVVENKQESVLAALKALARAEEFVKQNPEKSFQILRRALPEETEASLKAAWNVMIPRLGLNNLLLLTLEQESEFYHQQTGRQPLDFATADLVTSRYLETVLPESVTLLTRSGERNGRGGEK